MTAPSNGEAGVGPELLPFRRMTEEEADEVSFSVDDLPDGLCLTQARYYRWGDTAVIAVGELNYPNTWDDVDFDDTCRRIETALARSDDTLAKGEGE